MSENKDYIINIRVSKELYDKLKQKAKENRESLSNTVRKAVNDSVEIFGDLKKELFGRGKEGSDKFVHYQKVITAREMECDNCGALIPKGTQVFVGETKDGRKKYFCSNCFKES